MELKDLRGIYRDIATQSDIETALKIHKMLGGHQVAFPKSLYTAEYIQTSIKKEFNGSNVRELATKYGISERRVRQILHSE